MSGGWLYEWRLVGWLEVGCMSGGWLYEWRLVGWLEVGWMAGGWLDAKQKYTLDNWAKVLAWVISLISIWITVLV